MLSHNVVFEKKILLTYNVTHNDIIIVIFLLIVLNNVFAIFESSKNDIT